MIEEMTITLNSPITDEQWDAITDVDFDHTDRIWFHTKHGKDVEFVKRKRGRWLWELADNGWADHICSECGWTLNTDIHVGIGYKFCPYCGADMRGEDDGHKH